MTKKNKIILRVAPYPTFEESGRGLHPYELSKLINTKVIYLTFFSRNSKYFEVPKNVILKVGSFYSRPFPRKSNFIYRSIFHIYRLLKIFIFSMHGIFLALWYKVDLVHIHSAMFSPICFVTKFFGIKNIISFHGADYFRVEKALWYKYFAFCFDLVLSISPRYVQRLKEIHNCNVIQIYNGIDPKIYKNFNRIRNKQILSVVNFKPQKGLIFLINGFKSFHENYPSYKDYKLVIAGKGILFKEMEKYISQIKMENSIILIGQKNRNELIKLYNESEIFVLPSIWEGFAKVLLEAMSCGCKVISTNVDSAPILLSDWGYMVKHSSSEEISISLKKIIENKNYNYSEQKKSVNNFTWNYIRKIYQDCIFEL